MSFFPIQTPAPGERRVVTAATPIVFRLTVPTTEEGQAFLRTTAGKLRERRREVIHAVEGQHFLPNLTWHDLPMTEVEPGVFEIVVSEDEIGLYEARAFFAPKESDQLKWPEAQGNVTVKVEPTWATQGLGIYSAFVRLFREKTEAVTPTEAQMKEMDAAGFTVIPPSGTLRQFAKQLDHILIDLGFSVVLVLPVFPSPTTWAKMGRFGSPFAPLDFYTVDPALAEFDLTTTPLDQFREVIDGVHRRDGRLFIDIPINHTGWASRMLTLHPEWYCREPNGEFKSPGAWGVKWEDLVELHYDDQELWQEMAAVFLHWCREGVDGFRCDAGYMIPTPVWEYITAKVREEFPDTIFLLEGLGGPIPKMMELLSTGGLNWAYSELFQNYDRGAIHWYLPQAFDQSAGHGLQVNFAETHDNNRLAAQGKMWSRLRTALSALTSPQGAWGVTCGVEWYADEKIAVHGISSMNWGQSDNLVTFVGQLNSLLKSHPSFGPGTALRLITTGNAESVVMLRSTKDPAASSLIVANLDLQNPSEVRWPTMESPLAAGSAGVLFDSEGYAESVTIHAVENDFQVTLAPGQVLCLGIATPCIPSAQAQGRTGLVSEWQWPRDERREVVWLDGTPLVIKAAVKFDAQLVQDSRVIGVARAERSPNGTWEIPFSADRIRAGEVELRLVVHETTRSVRTKATIWRAVGLPEVNLSVTPSRSHYATLTNNHGALCQVRGAWGLIETQYDTFFGANLDPLVPVDRRMLLGRVRIWVTRLGYSTALDHRLVRKFSFLTPNRAVWDFVVPCGGGLTIPLRLVLTLAMDSNQISLRLEHTGAETIPGIRVIVRPDIEDRGFHEKSFFPAEVAAAWQASMENATDGFAHPRWDGSKFHLWMEDAVWRSETEVVGVGHAIDAERGQAGGAELFSPGWLGAALPPQGSLQLNAAVTEGSRPAPLSADPVTLRSSTDLATAAAESLRQFIVKRDDSLTIIAGYPWFLDWGRDTLICLRGVIAAGWFAQARDTLITFARFEKLGTLPNMIRGNDDSNRDTVDAPLWFFVATQELLAAEKSDSFLHEQVGERTILEILRSIAENYIKGTHNGIAVDPASGLVFSPSHYTWMDTNHPAGTPRQGYPISAQAKWHAGLRLLARVDADGSERWTKLADQVRESVGKYFVHPTHGWLSDCLHAHPGQAAADATADDHLRPNQLLSVTLGLITDETVQKAIVQACGELIVPGALRTLADRPVEFPLIVERHGWTLNNPTQPFWPQYSGDEDTRRKPAYHNGTAWPWLMPMLAEAMLIVYGPEATPAANALLGTAGRLFSNGSLGNVPEVLDGGAPHAQKGCGAQAWSVSELVRVLT